MSAKHRASMPFETKAAIAVMTAGAVAALACTFGSIWVVRAGVVVALLAGGIALMQSMRQIRRLNEAHRLELRAVRRAASEAAAQHHAESMEIIETFRARHAVHTEQMATLRADLAATQVELSTVRGNLVSARAESSARADQIAALEAELARHEKDAAELVAKLRDLQGEDAEIVTLPQRAISRKALAAMVPTADELWRDGDHPTSFTMESVDLMALINGSLMGEQQRRHA